jgi:heme-degrading monooxygenase HmoA
LIGDRVGSLETHNYTRSNLDMVTVGMNYKVLEGKEKVFEDAFTNVLKAMEADEGHQKSNLYKDVSDERSYLIVSDWNSEDAFNGFVRSESFAKVVNWGKEQILAGRPSHQVYKN